MKSKIKMWISLFMLLLFGILYQIFAGNQGALIVGGILLFSVGFGWYAKCTKIEENQNEKR